MRSLLVALVVLALAHSSFGLDDAHSSGAKLRRMVRQRTAASASASATGPQVHKMACLFLHGQGMHNKVGPKIFNGASRGPVGVSGKDASHEVKISELIPYWGTSKTDVAKAQVEAVCDPYYIFSETRVRGWDNPALQKEYCDAVETVGAAYTAVAVFTHSMGNSLIASGIQDQLHGCNRFVPVGAPAFKAGDAHNAFWFAVSGVWGGSDAATLMDDVMTKKFERWIGILSPAMVRHALDAAFGDGHEHPLPSVVTLGPSYVSKTAAGAVRVSQQQCGIPEIKAWATAHPGYACVPMLATTARYAHGSLCSNNIEGLGKLKFGPIDVAKSLREYTVAWANSRQPNAILTPYLDDWKNSRIDILVPEQSCFIAKHDKNAVQTTANAYYVSRINHADSTGTFGDGTAADQKPNAWIVARIQQALSMTGLASGASSARFFAKQLDSVGLADSSFDLSSAIDFRSIFVELDTKVNAAAADQTEDADENELSEEESDDLESEADALEAQLDEESADADEEDADAAELEADTDAELDDQENEVTQLEGLDA